MRRSTLVLTLALLATTAGSATAQPWYYYGWWGRDPVADRISAFGDFAHGMADFARGVGEYNRAVADSYKVFMESEIVRQKALQERLVTYRQTLETMEFGIRKEAELVLLHKETTIEKNALLIALEATPAEIATGIGHRKLRLFMNNNFKKLDPNASEVIPRDCLKDINFRVGRYEQGGPIGLLRDAKLQWPGLLQDRVFDRERQEFDRILTLVVGHAKVSGAVPQEEFGQLKASLDRLARILEDNWGRVDPDTSADKRWDWVTFKQAERFLTKDMRLALRDLVLLTPEEFAAVMRPAEVRTVLDLLLYMREKGLEFAPAQDKQVTAYNILYQAMAEEAKKIRTLPGPGGLNNPSSSR